MAIRVVGLAVNFAVLAVIGQVAGSEALGIVLALNGAAFIGGAVCSLGAPTLLLKTMTGHLLRPGLAEAVADYRRSLGLAAAGGTAGMVVLLLVAGLQQAGFLPTPGNFGPAETVALGFCSACLAVQSIGLSAVRSLKQPVLSGLFQFCTQPITLLLAVGAVEGLSGGLSTVNAPAAVSAGIAVNAATVVGYLHWRLGPATELVQLPSYDRRELRSLWSLGILGNASSNAPLVLAGALLPAAGVASIGVPFRICNLPMTVVTSLGAYYSPLLREALMRGDHASARGALRQSRVLGVFAVLPVVVVALVAPMFALGLFGVVDPAAAVPFAVFAIAQACIASCGVSEQLLVMGGRADMANRCTFAGLVAFALLGWGGFRFWGTTGLAVAWGLTAAIRQAALWMAARNLIANDGKRPGGDGS